MPGLEEAKTVWRYRIRDPADFSVFRVKELGKGVKITLGKIKNSQRWEIQNYLFEKESFKTREQVRSWIEGHLKGAIHTLLDFRAFGRVQAPSIECLHENLRSFIVMVIKMSQQKKQTEKSVAEPETKSMLEDWQGFRAWQEALYKSRGKRIPTV